MNVKIYKSYAKDDHTIHMLAKNTNIFKIMKHPFKLTSDLTYT